MDAKTRKKTATVVVGDKPKYPIPDKKHAELAIGRIDQATPPLNPAQKSAVRKRAANFGVGTAPKHTKDNK